MTRSASSLQTPDFQALFESAPDSYLVLTPDLAIIAVNNAYLRATMTKREEILGRGVFEVFADNLDEPSATGVSNLRASLERVIQNRVGDVMAVQKYDVRCPTSVGGGVEKRYGRPVNTPVFGPDGEVTYIIHRVEDVTEFFQIKLQQTRVHPTVGGSCCHGLSKLDGLRILVVDDEADARELVVCILEDYGAMVTAVATTDEVIRVLTEPASHIDVLISDIGMPKEDGYTLIRRVRSLLPESGGRIPALALTSYARAEDRKSALCAGFQSHIAKPVDPDELVEAIANLAGRTG